LSYAYSVQAEEINKKTTKIKIHKTALATGIMQQQRKTTAKTKTENYTPHPTITK